MTLPSAVDVAVVGAGAAGVGTAAALSRLDLECVVLDREEVGATFRKWPAEMRFITPSFPSNSFGLTDLNAVTPRTSPAYTLERQQPSGEEYADYLEAVVDFHDLSVVTGVDVTGVTPLEETPDEDIEEVGAGHAVDGGTALDASVRDGFVLETSAGSVYARFVVWAGGQFSTPRGDLFDGTDLCVHSSSVRSWADHAAASSTREFLIVGGYESGIDAAVALVDAGCSVTVLDRGLPWARRDPDPSETLAPYTLERLARVEGSDRLDLVGGVDVERVRRTDDGCFEVRTRAVSDGETRTFTVPTQPVLATGFEPTLGPVAEYFPFEDGHVSLTDVDESPTTPGLFLSGPAVTHNGVQFCFIYKFRTRFAVVAKAVGERLGVDLGPLEEYREQGMFLEDLSCCEPDMCGC
ncbi:NAD(P)/FAD-dependent oxidoreductase [Natronobiforma cellulositropha]|uniref:NAD(P)/FAD-dependent oxidoreductase n=1 Tax=Natronobiforma cellulositropha TaxID=1679076 RepID=UPI0021D595F2|nr:NAD(P)/FAD-dependent oxidoreductase [Natronobiforma cellulositropha]